MSMARRFILAAAVLTLVFATGLSAAAGDLDTSFNGTGKVLTDFAGGSNDLANGVAVQADGKVVVAGGSNNETDSSFAVVRYTVNGALDPAFDGDGKVRTDFTSSSTEWAQSLAIQPDGKIVVIGPVGLPGNGTGADFGLVRYNADGTLDAGFSGDGKVVIDFAHTTDFPESVALQSDGKIVVAGSSRPFGTQAYDFAVARYNQDGSLDGSFDGDGKVITNIFTGSDDFATRVAVQTDGRVVAGGVASIGSAYSAVLVRYMPDGSLDGSFDGDGKVVVTTPTDSINDLALQPDGKIVTAGGASHITRFNADGSVDNTFAAGSSPFPSPFALAIQRDGRIVAAAPTGYPASDFGVTRYGPNGALDLSFGSGGTLTTDLAATDIPAGVALAPDGKIVVAGIGGPAGAGPNDFAVVRYLAAPPQCKVPNVRGKKLAAAKASIRRARCTAGKVTRKPSKRVKKGRVISQSPRAGATVPSGGKVNLVISKGRRR
ncbi:MAG TPA: PASTA domain-containing protein [Gaiellaceae bacterium]|nr:PASTA domain-containing protein [Gaiellaceae bacterium]